MKSKILLCLSIMFILKLEISSVNVQGPHHHPIYKYSCNEDLSVTFKGVKGTVQSFPNSSSCSILERSKHKGTFSIPKSCLSPIEFNETRKMKVAVYDTNENENPPTPRPSTNTLISGGYHIFEITCLPLELVGVERIALAETGITDIEQLHNVYNEIDQVEMRFKEGESLDKPDLSEVYIGDRFYMYLKYMGDTEQYIIMPQSCTAYKGTYRNEVANGNLELWKHKNVKSTDCLEAGAKTYNVMKNFKRLNSTVVHAELHGFRFASKLDGSFSDVTISCTVTICTSAKGPCASNCGIEKVSYRRKRETGTIRSQTVSKTLKVRTRKFDSNDAGRTSYNSGIVGTITASILFYILRK